MSDSELPVALLEPPIAAMSGLLFRLVGVEDLRPLHHACYTQLPLRQFEEHFHEILRWQGKKRAYWLLGLMREQIVSTGQLLIYPHGAEVANLQVIPPYRGRGIGTAMLVVLSRVARHLQLSGLEVGVISGNRRALTLYQRLGFVEDRRVALVSGETAVILYKVL